MGKLLSTEEVIEVVDGVRHLLTNENAWTQCKLARDADGFGIVPTEDDAVCWCLEGAIVYVQSGRDSLFDEVEEVLVGNLPKPYTTLVEFNDSGNTVHAEILTFLDSTMESLENTL